MARDFDGDELIVLSSAFRHGISEDDMLHVTQTYMRSVEQDDGVLMLIGTARPGHPVLEVGLIEWHGAWAICHAMKARDRYLPGK